MDELKALQEVATLLNKVQVTGTFQASVLTRIAVLIQGLHEACQRRDMPEPKMPDMNGASIEAPVE